MTISYRGFMRERIQKDVATVSPEATFFEARALIHEKGIRYLPVVDKSKSVVGIVTSGDIRKASPSDATLLSVHEFNFLLGKLTVSDFMTPKERLITITPDTVVEEAARLLSEHKVSCLPVLEEGRLYGLFTETDALDLLVDVFGLKQKGTRLTIALEDKPNKMLGVLEVFRKYDVNIISIASPSYVVEGKRVAAIRVETGDCEAIVRDLEKAGYPGLSVGSWPSE
jgi:acetoin utilization protein AcuB